MCIKFRLTLFVGALNILFQSTIQSRYWPAIGSSNLLFKVVICQLLLARKITI